MRFDVSSITFAELRDLVNYWEEKGKKVSVEDFTLIVE